MKMVKKKFRSYEQHQLQQISDMVCDNIEELLNILGITEYKLLNNMVSMSCPIHGGDNVSACNLYYTGDSYRGNWKCRTHQCEQIFKPSILGFIRGCLSHSQNNWTHNGDNMVSFNDAIEFATKLTKGDISNIPISKKEKEKAIFTNTIKHLNKGDNSIAPKISRKTIIKNLQIPSPYFLSRNFSKEILIKYDVGECSTQGKEMYNRAVVPIYDTEHTNMVGCTGRSISELKPKWKHNDGFHANQYLYNFWYAKDFIKSSGSVILVESPGNVWRLEEAGIHNSVAIFGSSLGDRQKMLLDTSGAMTIITIMDNDEAGKRAAENIFSKCEKTYNLKNILLSYSDIADMTVSQIIEEIKPLIGEYLSC